MFGLILLTILSFISVICYNESCISNMRNKFWTKFCLVVLFTVTSMYKENNTKVFWPSFDPIITSYLERTVLQVGISTSIFHVNSRDSHHATLINFTSPTFLVWCDVKQLYLGLGTTTISMAIWIRIKSLQDCHQYQHWHRRDPTQQLMQQQEPPCYPKELPWLLPYSVMVVVSALLHPSITGAMALLKSWRIG